MTGRRRALRLPLLALALLAVIGAVAIPALAASPSPGAAAASAAASDHPGRGPKASKEPEVAVTLQGVVAASTDPDGDPVYTITVNGKAIELDAGPPWFHGENHPLKAYVGKTVTITGGQRGDEVDVETIDGVRLRAEGRPPWAGGWKAVGSAHPGWSQEKADRWAAKHAAKVGDGAAADCWPPGHCKEHGPDGSDDPDESEAPGTN